MSADLEKSSKKRWTGPEKWQVALAALGLLVAVIALVGPVHSVSAHSDGPVETGSCTRSEPGRQLIDRAR